MMTKIPVRRLILAFCLLPFGSSCSPPPTGLPPASGPKDPTVEAVQRVVTQAGLDQSRISATYKGGDGSPVDYFKERLRLAKRRDLAGCPPEFAEAFEKGLKATERALRVALDVESEVKTMKKWEAIALLDKPTSETERAVQDADREREKAAKAVRDIAAKYGAPYPKEG